MSDQFFVREVSGSEEDYDSEKSDIENVYHPQRNNFGNDSDEIDTDSEDESQREKSELQLRREANIKRSQAFLENLMKDPQFADVVATANELKQTKLRKAINTNKDPSFRSYTRVERPLEQRRSSRLQNIPPVFFKEDLIDEAEISRKRKRSQDYDYYDLETVIYRPRTSKPIRNADRTDIIPVEDVTDQMIANIARKGTIKLYSESGTSCHQCRQKTKDQKSCCRSARCIGVRGQFCGVCLENRYGEDVAVALKDPQWKCPVCRNICNCSFCRQKAGKRPTGILAPLAQQNGHKSVKDFLESLKGEGDYAHQDALWQKMHDPKYLLGFSKDEKFAQMGGNVRHEMNCSLDLKKMNRFIWEKKNQLESMIDFHEDSRSLLGFFKNSHTALMDDGSYCCMDPFGFKSGEQDVATTSQIKTTGSIPEVPDSERMERYISGMEIKVESIDLLDNSRSLLGFFKNSNTALMDDGTYCSMSPVRFKSEVETFSEKNQITITSSDIKTVENSPEVPKIEKIDTPESMKLQGDARSLLGFFKNSNTALMDDGSHCCMHPVPFEPDNKEQVSATSSTIQSDEEFPEVPEIAKWDVETDNYEFEPEEHLLGFLEDTHMPLMECNDYCYMGEVLFEEENALQIERIFNKIGIKDSVNK